MTRNVALLGIGLFAAAVHSAPAGAQSLHVFRDGVSPTSAYNGTRDVTLSEQVTNVSVSDPDTNYANSENELGGFPVRQVTLLRFDISSAVPRNATIDSVQLRLHVLEGSQASYEIREVLVPWGLNEATWNQRLPGVRWSVPGALGPGTDRGADLLGTVTGSAGFQTFTFTAAGVAAVQRWAQNPQANNGLWIGGFDNEDGLTFTSCASNNDDQHPELIVRYNGGSEARFKEDVAPTRNYDGADDTIIASGPKRSSNFNSLGLRVSGLGAQRFTSLLRFDVSSIPRGTPVTGVSIELSVHSPSNTEVTLFEALREWSEANATWMSTGIRSWSTAGALGQQDRGVTALGTFTPANTGSPRFSLNAEGVALVQKWITGERPNNGFILSVNSSGAGVAARDREELEASLRPALFIETGTGTGVVPEDGEPGIENPISPPSNDPIREQTPSVGELVQTRVNCGCTGGGASGPFALALMSLGLLAWRTRGKHRSATHERALPHP